MKSRPIDEPFDGPSHMMDGGEPLVYTASEVEKIKAEVRREVVEECIAVLDKGYAISKAWYYKDVKADLDAIAKGGEE